MAWLPSRCRGLLNPPNRRIRTRTSGGVPRHRCAVDRFGRVAWRLRQPDDGVKRGAQLVAHAGDELRLVLARDLKLTALVLYFRERSTNCRDYLSAFDNSGRCSKVSYVAPLSEDIDLK